MRKFTGGIKKIIPSFPLWSDQLLVPKKLKITHPPKRHSGAAVFNNSIVYLPSCISNMMGGSAHKKNIYETFLNVSAKAGIEVVIPVNAASSCCGQLFSSKGFSAAHVVMCNKTIEKLWETTQEGKLPVVLDVSSCTYTLQHCRPVLNAVNQSRFDQLNIIDSIDYLHDYVLPLVQVKEKKTSVVLHPVCSLEKMGLQKKMQHVAAKFAEVVNVPLHAGCCGMAGDRGFLFPELTASATAPEAEEVKQQSFTGYYSSAKTCELTLSGATGANYESLLYLVDECI